MENQRPYIILKAAMSLDGFIDDSSDKRRIFSSPEDWSAVEELRASCDAILLGAGTLRADNPKLLISRPELKTKRLANELPADLIKVTLTSTGNLDPALNFFRLGAGEKYVYTLSHRSEHLQQELKSSGTVIAADSRESTYLDSKNSIRVDRIDLAFVLEDLFRRGVKRLLVEGGASVLAKFIELGTFDEMRIAVAPLILADSRAPSVFSKYSLRFSTDFELSSVEQLGTTSVLRYLRMN